MEDPSELTRGGLDPNFEEPDLLLECSETGRHHKVQQDAWSPSWLSASRTCCETAMLILPNKLDLAANTAPKWSSNVDLEGLEIRATSSYEWRWSNCDHLAGRRATQGCRKSSRTQNLQCLSRRSEFVGRRRERQGGMICCSTDVLRLPRSTVGRKIPAATCQSWISWPQLDTVLDFATSL